ncbi:hypothetical protein K490DRAFT_55789 [Saccharata proteae CBS 121410]|uniref:Uncharacterized protein n=1 Tax=Saccharata proteae CBS 121410 TaxID=1314787 RepID=A0A6A5YBV0_9PEZI|nr:hypothetical protein K490DRAFT_55789 [Saccharata proteae CBS 121410]
MCGGDCENGRASVGGTIAVMRPTRETVVDEPAANCDLLFDKVDNKTQATLRTKNGSCFSSLTRYLIVIHRTGDLTALPPKDELLNAMHAMPIAPKSSNGVATMELPEELELSVGATGVIGRKVSLMASDGSATVAEGIIGWN